VISLQMAWHSRERESGRVFQRSTLNGGHGSAGCFQRMIPMSISAGTIRRVPAHCQVSYKVRKS
jgi:hypothetical protein